MLKAKLAGDSEDQRWSLETYLLAATHDFIVNGYALEFYKVGKKPPFNPRDVRIKRPGEKRQSEVATQNARALLASMRGERAQANEVDFKAVTIDVSKVKVTDVIVEVEAEEEPKINP